MIANLNLFGCSSSSVIPLTAGLLTRAIFLSLQSEDDFSCCSEVYIRYC